jgi:hypothetical protein
MEMWIKSEWSTDRWAKGVVRRPMVGWLVGGKKTAFFAEKK